MEDGSRWSQGVVLGLACGSILEKKLNNLNKSANSCWVMGVVLDFGKIGGVGRVRCVSFPSLYVVAASKGATVGEVWETKGGGG